MSYQLSLNFHNASKFVALKKKKKKTKKIRQRCHPRGYPNIIRHNDGAQWLIKKNFVCGCGDGRSTRCDSILYSMLSSDCTFKVKSQSNTSRDDNYCEVGVDVDGSTKRQ